MKILILDDEPLIVAGLAACLAEHETMVAYTGYEALKKAREFLPDLMLVDVNLPDISGIDVVAKLEEERVCPTIFLTAYSDRTILERAKMLKGVHGYLVKPIDERSLKTTIEISLAKFHEQTETNLELAKVRQSLAERKIVERAKGIIMEQMKISEPQAMKFLQEKSKKTNRKLVDTAKYVIDFFSDNAR